MAAGKPFLLTLTAQTHDPVQRDILWRSRIDKEERICLSQQQQQQ